MEIIKITLFASIFLKYTIAAQVNGVAHFVFSVLTYK